MFSMTNWIYMLKTVFKSKYSQNELRNMIVSKCLSRPEKFLGAYCVDHQKVWDIVVKSDKKLFDNLLSQGIQGPTDVMSYYEEMQYRWMRSTYPRKARFRRR